MFQKKNPKGEAGQPTIFTKSIQFVIFYRRIINYYTNYDLKKILQWRKIHLA